jgi:hypothetical protein
MSFAFFGQLVPSALLDPSGLAGTPRGPQASPSEARPRRRPDADLAMDAPTEAVQPTDSERAHVGGARRWSRAP